MPNSPLVRHALQGESEECLLHEFALKSTTCWKGLFSNVGYVCLGNVGLSYVPLFGSFHYSTSAITTSFEIEPRHVKVSNNAMTGPWVYITTTPIFPVLPVLGKYLRSPFLGLR